MILIYQPKHLEKGLTDETKLTRKYGNKIAAAIVRLIGFLEDSTCLYDVYAMPQYMMELLKGDLAGCYSLTLDKKKSKWRVILVPLDENNEPIRPSDNEIGFLKSVKAVAIRRISEHYD